MGSSLREEVWMKGLPTCWVWVVSFGGREVPIGGTIENISNFSVWQGKKESSSSLLYMQHACQNVWLSLFALAGNILVTYVTETYKWRINSEEKKYRTWLVMDEYIVFIMADMSFSSFRPVTESSSNVYYATVCYHLLYFSKMKDDNFCRLCFFKIVYLLFELDSFLFQVRKTGKVPPAVVRNVFLIHILSVLET